MKTRNIRILFLLHVLTYVLLFRLPSPSRCFYSCLLLQKFGVDVLIQWACACMWACACARERACVSILHATLSFLSAMLMSDILLPVHTLKMNPDIHILSVIYWPVDIWLHGHNKTAQRELKEKKWKWVKLKVPLIHMRLMNSCTS